MHMLRDLIPMISNVLQHYQVCHLLEWEARRCFETRCSSNSYTPHRYTYTTNI